MVAVSQECTLEHSTAVAPDLVYPWVTCHQAPGPHPRPAGSQSRRLRPGHLHLPRIPGDFYALVPLAPHPCQRGVSRVKMGGPRAGWEFPCEKNMGKGPSEGCRTWGQKVAGREPQLKPQGACIQLKSWPSPLGLNLAPTDTKMLNKKNHKYLLSQEKSPKDPGQKSILILQKEEFCN